jgi:cytoskeletal protein CcmA (bactofilin family)
MMYAGTDANSPQKFCLRWPNNRRGTAFLTAMMFLVILLGFGAIFVEMSMQGLARASRIRKETRALQLAESGIDYAAWYLYEFTPTTYPFMLHRTDMTEGSSTAVVTRYLTDSYGTAVPHAVQIIGTGVSQGFTVQVKTIGQYSVLSTTTNPVFDNALFSNADLTLKGTTDIIGSVFTNANLKAQGAAQVNGPAGAVGTITESGQILGTKTPHAAKKVMPTIDLAYYKAHATTIYNGDHTFSSTTTLSGITYVKGNVHLSGQISGKGVIVVEGTVQVDGGVTLTNSTTDEFAIVSSGNVKINGNCTIQGVIYAHNVTDSAAFSGNGTANVTGAVVADVITCNGTLNVTYKKPTVDVPGGQDQPSQVAIVSWRRIK